MKTNEDYEIARNKKLIELRNRLDESDAGIDEKYHRDTMMQDMADWGFNAAIKPEVLVHVPEVRALLDAVNIFNEKSNEWHRGNRIMSIPEHSTYISPVLKALEPFEQTFREGGSMKVEPGKFYITRDGNKVRVYAQENTGDGFSVHGAILSRGRWEAENWFKTGMWTTTQDVSDEDIVGPWVDPNKTEKWAFVEEAV